MAVEDKYTHANFQSGTALLNKLLPAIFGGGAPIKAMFGTVEIAAADDDGSVYRLFKGVDGTIIPLMLLVATDGITGMSDVDFGVYNPDLGAVISKDCLADGLSLASAADFGFATALDGMDNVAIENYSKMLYEHAGHTNITQKREYDVCMTANTVGSGAGTVAAILIFAGG